jgi:hypothetical protein
VIAGERRPNVPLYVLISPRTASAAEEFAYNMQTRKRATLIGRTTAGAANPGDSFEFSPGWHAFVSTGKAINPVTGQNWEGVGVSPDIDVDPADAFDFAYDQALEQMAQTADEPALTELTWTNAYRSALTVPTPTADLAELPGAYGARAILADSRRLLYRRGKRAPWTMLGPVDGAYYFVESDRMRVRFRRTGEAATELIEEFVDGFSRGFAR